MNVWPKFWNS